MLKLKGDLKTFLDGSSRVVVLGVGSDLRGDDAAGVRIIEKLREHASSKLILLDGGTAPENLTGEIKRHKPSHLIIIDAADLKAPVGTIKLLKPEEIGGYSFSTHALPLKIMIDFIWQDVACQVLVIAIQPRNLSFGAAMSKEVEEAVGEVVGAIGCIAET